MYILGMSKACAHDHINSMHCRFKLENRTAIQLSHLRGMDAKPLDLRPNGELQLGKCMAVLEQSARGLQEASRVTRSYCYSSRDDQINKLDTIKLKHVY